MTAFRLQRFCRTFSTLLCQMHFPPRPPRRPVRRLHSAAV